MRRIFLALLTIFVSTPAQAETNSFSRLMAAGQSVQCSFQKPDGSQKGTIYVSGEKLYGDIETAEAGPERPMHMIRDTEKMYTWGGEMGEKQGMILPARMGAGSPMGGPQPGADMDEEMDFSCQPWSADASKFVPPSDVEFQDMAQLMSAYAGAMGSMNQ